MNRVRWGLAAACAAAVFVLPAVARAGNVVIDDFTTPQGGEYSTQVYPGSGQTGKAFTATGSGILGGERDIDVHDVSGNFPSGYQSDGFFNWVGDGIFQEFAQIGITGSVQIAYDGQDGSATSLDPTGLGGVDLTSGGANDRFFLRAGDNSGLHGFTITVYTDASHYSSATFGLPFIQSIGQTEDLTVPFSSFAAGSGAAGPADLSDVGAITVSWTNGNGTPYGSGEGPYIGLIETTSPPAPVDTTPPTITASASTADGAYAAGTWTTKPVTVTFACTDAGSGVASVTGPQTVSGDVSGKSVTGTCTDKAGNQASATFSGIDIDATAPTVDATAATADGPYTAGTWASKPVTVTFTCTDATSGVASVTAPLTVTADTGSARGTCTDRAGNSAAASFGPIRIDTTAPAITASASTADGAYVAGTWTTKPVTVTFACTDGGSGVAGVTGPQTVSADGADQSVTGTCTDAAGNPASTTFSGIDVDATAPVVTASASTADGPYAAGTWATKAVTVAFSCSDGTSGVGSVTDPVTVSATTPSVQGTCTDKAGNTATASFGPVQIDATAPTIVATVSPAPNAAGWNNGPVTVTFACADSGSGVASCPQPVTVTAEGAAQSVSGTATDAAGNSATTTVSVSIDTTAPVVSFSSHPGSYGLTDTVTITCSATDALSGIASSTCHDVSAPAYTFGAGTTTLTAAAADAAGNTGTASTSFTVAVDYDGLCMLTKQLVTKKLAAVPLCAALEAAELADKHGATRAKQAAIDVYVKLLTTGVRLRTLSSADAATLAALAKQL